MKAFIFACLLIITSTASCADDAITPSPALPKATPWNLQKLSEPPKFEWLTTDGPVRSLLYEGEPLRGKPTRVFAYYATPGTLAGDPSKDRDLPAMVLIHGGGGTAFREWVELWAKRGYAAISMDLAGSQPIEEKDPHRPENRTRLPDGGPGQGDDEKFGWVNKAPEEQWSYHAVAAAIRAHSLIRSFPEVDREKTGVTGISWGGYVTCIVAGLDNRFKAAVPVYGCGFLDENSAWLERFAKMSPAERERWSNLWDPSRYLPAVSMPICFMNGTHDLPYPLDSHVKSFDLVPGPKQIRITHKMPHSHPDGWAPIEIGLFIDQNVRNSVPLPVVRDPKISGDEIEWNCESSTKLRKAEMWLTTDRGPILKREWKSIPASVTQIGGRWIIRAPASPAEVTGSFVIVEDERGAIASSRPVLVPTE